jgi:hypothetical protein
MCFAYVEGYIFSGKARPDPPSESDGQSKSWILICHDKRKAYEKVDLVESLDHNNIVQIENQKARIESN